MEDPKIKWCEEQRRLWKEDMKTWRSERRGDRFVMTILSIIAIVVGFGLAFFPLSRAFGAEPPAFTVENKTPQFAVTNRIPDGGTKPLPDPGSPATSEVIASNPPSYTYKSEYHPQLGGWVTVRYENSPSTIAAPGVAASSPFRNTTVQYNASHRCNACGYESPPGQGTWIVRGYNPDGKTHRHQCPQCGNQWFH